MARLVSGKLKAASVSFNDGSYKRGASKAQETRVRIYFPDASTAGNMHPVSVAHDLRKTPVSYAPVGANRDPTLGAPGTVFDIPPWASPTHVTLCCTTGGTSVDLILR